MGKRRKKRNKRKKTLELTMLLSIEKTITDLANSDKPLLNSRLIDLSNLNPEEIRILEQAWEVPFSFSV